MYLEDSECSSIICSHGSECRIDDNGRAQCFCPDDCNEYARTMSLQGYVCGSDNRTYESLCELNKRACQTQQNLTLAYFGECSTFLNSFLLLVLLLKNKNICLFIDACHHSNCSKNVNECNPHIQCLFDYRPLCASNLQQYSNECEMNKYACQSNIPLTKLHDGPCDIHEQRQQIEGNGIDQ